MAPSAAFVMTNLDVRTASGAAGSGSASASASGGRRSAQVLSWTDDNRSLRIGPGAQSYVEVHENFNAGWAATLNGRPLPAVELDGWQQAFLVPAGQGGLIKLKYTPATIYHAGLIAAGVALVVLAVIAIVPGGWVDRRRTRRRGRQARRRAARQERRDRRPGPAEPAGESRRAAPQPGWREPWESVPEEPALWEPVPWESLTAESRRGEPEPWKPEPWGTGDIGHPSVVPDGASHPAGGRDARKTRRLSTVPARRMGRSAVRTVAVFLPLAVVIGIAGGPIVVAVPVLAALGYWRPRWLPWVALGAMLLVGVVAITGQPGTLGDGAFSGAAQACALVALTAALIPDTARTAPRPADLQEDVS